MSQESLQEAKAREGAARGSRAREVLENEEFQSAFSAIEQELTQAWITSPVRDADGREKLYQHLVALRKIKAVLEKTLDSGKLARADLDFLERRRHPELADRFQTVWERSGS
jgi:hypothetical protein